jgi:hypothetical protein
MVQLYIDQCLWYKNKEIDGKQGESTAVETQKIMAQIILFFLCMCKGKKHHPTLDICLE